ncbi:ATP-binding protein [Paenibacillus methanolicus]|uniref:histidine kinase n=1 Tax=Paenibacillus methanolicus TaxID=582686 RepID=A0A5S5BN41_9BACL|nr:ATP-binding protein [Paenibacillus methanolicus]TYP68354.1 PAS domain S-box-containing protein [Paenibacillus methanolicus]
MSDQFTQLNQLFETAGSGHVLYVYENRDAYTRQAVSFIASGIEQGHQVIVIDRQDRYDRIFRALRGSMSDEQLGCVRYVNSLEFYRVQEPFCCGMVLEQYKDLLVPLSAQGIAFRLWAHAEWPENAKVQDELEMVEQLADYSVTTQGFSSVCCYDGAQTSAAMQHKLLRHHAYWLTDQALVTSPLYAKDGPLFPISVPFQEERGHANRESDMRRKTEERLRATKSQLESFITRNLDPIIILNQDEKVIRVNEAFERLFGWTNEEVMGLKAAVLPTIPLDRRYEVPRNKHVNMTGRNVEGYESLRYRKDGTPVNVMISSFPLLDEDDNPNGRAVIVRDITERMQAQELLIRTEKLSIAGELAAGIAHEIRNPVTAVKGFLHLLQTGGASKQLYFDIMASEIQRIETILSELLMLAKPQAVHFQSRNIPALIRDVITLLDAQANLNNVRILTDFEDENLCLECEENQIKQVCINFIKNAIEAMPGGGELLIQLARGDGMLFIRFVDQGGGIPEHVLARLGQPFYTTKEKGTGLGFMVSRKIIENHNGTVRVFSEERRGTTIEVSLPLDSASLQ